MTDVLSDMEQDVVRDLTHLGLLYTFEHKKRWYYVPTLLSSGLSGGFSGDDGETKTVAAEGHVIVETNYRVWRTRAVWSRWRYFVSSRAPIIVCPISTSVCSRARACKMRFARAWTPNKSSPTSGRRATSKREKPSVPGTVSDQIRLWARDMHRVDAEECVLYCDFPVSGGFYDAVVAEAVKRDALAERDASRDDSPSGRGRTRR